MTIQNPIEIAIRRIANAIIHRNSVISLLNINEISFTVAICPWRFS